MKQIITPIGTIHSCFKEKFGIPRQSLLAKHSFATIDFVSPHDRQEAWKGIEEFSHIWIFFLFHQSHQDKNSLSVRPPRLGGEKKLGVFATRSPYRPNQVGQSVVKLESLDIIKGKVQLHLSGHDLLDGTPVLDVKPYIPQYDSIAHASSGWVEKNHFNSLSVSFDPLAIEQLAGKKEFKTLIEEVISLDPRPAQQRKKAEKKEYRMRLDQFDIVWTTNGDQATVQEILNLNG